MGSDPTRSEPCFFTKPGYAVVKSGETIAFPPMTSNLHYEIELVAALGGGGTDIAVNQALDHVFGYAAGIDLTRRDLQAAAKKAGQPWDMAKGFDRSAPLGAIAPVSAVGHPDKGGIRLAVNGILRQNSDLSDMIWSVAENHRPTVPVRGTSGRRPDFHRHPRRRRADTTRRPTRGHDHWRWLSWLDRYLKRQPWDFFGEHPHELSLFDLAAEPGRNFGLCWSCG